MPNPWDQTQLGPDTPGLDNSIQYGDIIRYNVVSQYQQMMANQTPMTYQQQHKYLTQSQFQYGADDLDIQRRSYNRNAEMTRHSYANSVMNVASDWGAFGAVQSIATAAGATGIASMAWPMLAPIVPMHFINKGMQMNMERQRYMQSTALDIESYRERIGMPALSYNQATALAHNLTNNAYQPGQFFNAQQQSEIHKIALSNDMLSAKTKGISKGDINQYEKNFKDLLDTVQTVVKVLNTTKEGGLSVIKEMQQQGFGTMNQIRSSLSAASAYGGLTGIGATNMLNIGAAGAAAVQGTSWTSAAGANLFMHGGAAAGYLANSGNVRAQEAVAMAGGVAQAGASIAGAQMNTLRSGIGYKVMAYMVDKGGVLNTDKMNKILYGNLSKYEITSGAAQQGYRYGPGGRATARRDITRVLNDMAENSPDKLSQVMSSTFEAWRQHKAGTREDQAWVFANGVSQGNERTAALIEQQLVNPSAYGAMAVSRAATDYAQSHIVAPPTEFQKLSWKAYGTLGSPFVNAGIGISNWAGEQMDTMTKARVSLARGTMIALDDITGGMLEINRGRGVGDPRKAYLRAYGIGTDITKERIAAVAGMSAGEINSSRIKKVTLNNWDYEGAVNRLTKKELQYVTQTLKTGLMGGTTDEIFKDPNMVKLLGISGDKSLMNLAKNNSDGASQAFLNLLYSGTKSISYKANQAMTNWDKFAQEKGNVGLASSVMGDMRRSGEVNIASWAQRSVEDYSRDTQQGRRDRATVMAAQKITAERQFKKVYDLGDFTGIGAGGFLTKEKELNLEAQGVLGFKASGKAKKMDIIMAAAGGATVGAVAGPAGAIVGGLYAAGSAYALSQKDTYNRDIKQRMFKNYFGEDVLTPEGQSNIIKKIEAGAYPSNINWSSIGLEGGKLNAFLSQKESILERAAKAQRLKDQKTVVGALSQMDLALGGTFKENTAAVTAWATDRSGKAALSKNDLTAIAGTWFGGDIEGVTKMYKAGDKTGIFSGVLNAKDSSDRNSRKLVLESQINQLKKMHWYDIGGVEIIDGDKKTKVGGSEREAEIAKREKELNELKAKDIVAPDKDPSSGRGLNSYVNPPVLNYWNNQWIL